MASRTPRPNGRGATRPPDPEDSYPHIPEPKQSHTGSLLAFVSVLAVLGFGFWTAVATLTGGNDKPAAKVASTPVATQVPGKVANPAATAAPTAAAAANPAGTPASKPATPGPNGGKVHTVGQGDTLSKIAAAYGTTVDAVMAANGITDRSKVLHIGDKLNIP